MFSEQFPTSTESSTSAERVRPIPARARAPSLSLSLSRSLFRYILRCYVPATKLPPSGRSSHLQKPKKIEVAVPGVVYGRRWLQPYNTASPQRLRQTLLGFGLELCDHAAHHQQGSVCRHALA